MKLYETLKKAKEAKNILSQLPNTIRQNFLRDCARNLENKTLKILEANQKDLENAKQYNLNSAMLERLMLNEKRIVEMANSLREIADFPDP